MNNKIIYVIFLRVNTPIKKCMDVRHLKQWTVGIFVVFFLLYHVACRILVPQLEIEPRPTAVKSLVLTTGKPGNSCGIFFFFLAIQQLHFLYRGIPLWEWYL